MNATASPVALAASPVRMAVLLAAAGLAWALEHYDPPGIVEVPEQQTVLVGSP